MSDPLPEHAALQQAEQEAVLCLSKLLQVWYGEAGLHGMLRSLDATLLQCHAIRDEFAANAATGDAAGEAAAEAAADAALRLTAERAALVQHLRFMLKLCTE